jgi:hypothetical protein
VKFLSYQLYRVSGTAVVGSESDRLLAKCDSDFLLQYAGQLEIPTLRPRLTSLNLLLNLYWHWRLLWTMTAQIRSLVAYRPLEDVCHCLLQDIKCPPISSGMDNIYLFSGSIIGSVRNLIHFSLYMIRPSTSDAYAMCVDCLPFLIFLAIPPAVMLRHVASHRIHPSFSLPLTNMLLFGPTNALSVDSLACCHTPEVSGRESRRSTKSRRDRVSGKASIEQRGVAPD